MDLSVNAIKNWNSFSQENQAEIAYIYILEVCYPTKQLKSLQLIWSLDSVTHPLIWFHRWSTNELVRLAYRLGHPDNSLSAGHQSNMRYSIATISDNAQEFD